MGAFKRERPAPKPPRAAAPRPRQAAPAAAAPRQARPTRRLRSVPPAARRAPAPADAPRALPFSAHRSMVASASILDLATSEARARYTKRRATSQGWQEEAWAYYDSIGEIKYAFGLVANTLSRVRLYPGYVADPAVPPVRSDPDESAGAAAAQALFKLDSAFGGLPGLMRDAALNIQVVGECNLVQTPGNEYARIPESWDIRSTDELQLDASGNMVVVPSQDGDKSTAQKLPKNAFAARIWRPHPRWSDEPDSSMRSLLDACAELLLLNKTFRSTARSRLNSGILYLPDGLSVAASADPDQGDPDGAPGGEPAFPEGGEPEGVATSVLFDQADQADTDEFEEALLEAMTTPIVDEESASAVVPLLVRGPADLGEKIRLIQFERSFDPALAERADRVLDRIMQGLDVPKEVVQGLANIKYSNAMVIDQQLYTSHIEPLALLICDAITTVYLQPSLRAAGIPEEEVQKHVIWYDASDVTTRPNRADDAEQGFQNYAVSYETWRRAHQFTEDDAPSPDEVAVRMLVEKGQLPPELTEALLAVVAPQIMQAVRDASQAANPAPLPPELVDALGEGGGGAAGEPPAPEPAPAAPAPAPAPPAAPSTPPPVPPAPTAPTAPSTPEPPLPFEEVAP